MHFFHIRLLQMWKKRMKEMHRNLVVSILQVVCLLMSVGLDDMNRGGTNSITASGTSRDWHQYGPPSLQSQTYQALKAPSKRAFDCQTKPQHQDFSKMIKRSKTVSSVCCAASKEMLPETKSSHFCLCPSGTSQVSAALVSDLQGCFQSFHAKLMVF